MMRFTVAIAALVLSACALHGSAGLPGAPGTTFRDCADCPEMIVVPDGSFTMGSPPAEKAWAAAHGGDLQSVADEAPQHTVRIRMFAIGRYVVTRGEYAAFVRETGHSRGDGCGVDGFNWIKRPDLDWRNPGFEQTDRDPVVCMSWQDAKAYVAWLNMKVARTTSREGPYRLPSEAEWEYAVRAGTTSAFWWGEDDGLAAEHAWYKANSNGRTRPVGLKPPNSFGLHDAVGNVWQWTEDCYAETYVNAPADGGASEAPADCMRVDRGSSWLFPVWLLRSATRERNPPDYRDAIMGFRVARSLP